MDGRMFSRHTRKTPVRFSNFTAERLGFHLQALLRPAAYGRKVYQGVLLSHSREANAEVIQTSPELWHRFRTRFRGSDRSARVLLLLLSDSSSRGWSFTM